MVQRYQLLKDTYMPLDGQWTIVLSGTVFDAPDTELHGVGTVTQLSPTEPAGTLGAHGKATSVRNVRRR